METMEPAKTLSSLFDKGKHFIKVAVIFIMAFFLWIPTNLILDLVKERRGRQKEAIEEISSKWAGPQTVTGPILMLPYNVYAKNEQGNTVTQRAVSYFLPDKSEVNAKLMPEKRYRGIYQAVVYRSDISISGKFKPLDLEKIKIAPENIIWDEAVMIFKVQDNLRGINEDLFVKWDEANLVFNPMSLSANAGSESFAASLALSPAEAAKEHAFQIRFSLNGSQKLEFATAARDFKLHMESTWPDPGFTGIKLPDTRKVSEGGFAAGWKIMNRSVPMVWNNQFYDLSGSVIGTDLLIPIDNYNKTERSIKYALLCIILTFAAFFLIESIYKRNLHLIQYGLAGLALVLFYTLLLSISEYAGFNLAYLVAGVATIGLVTWFVGSIMKSSKLAMFIGFVLTVVYSYIFIIIQMQDYSLLMGSIGLFIALGIIMYFSRKLQW
jgi:inner membrane protein